MIDSALNFLGTYVEGYGYLFAFLFAFFENSIFLGIVIPGETVIIFLAFYAAQGKIDPLTLTMFVILGSFMGDNIGYYLGHHYGRGFLKRFGRFISVDEDKFKIAEKYYKKHGVKTILWGRLIVVVRSFIPFSAGVSKVNYLKFVVLDFAGVIMTAVILISLGYFFGANWENIAGILGDFGVLFFLVFAIIIYRYIKGIKYEDK